ncbi:hypothetical protein FIU89_19300 [Roseovarius sp. THAF27]|uniref:hypothetical protein n=1 Tax=Roseovarius sp. THAF27 TaxID=2587850 RepID=UPI0012694230|nr:hypothetical protein [Roseovarius sp. THAF27]QFT82777.1 hypothetical protein FIU89_19300 [Roseovarius sp. THAF27]
MIKMTLNAAAILAALACDPVHAMGFGNPASVPTQWPEKGAFTCKSRGKPIASTRGSAGASVQFLPQLEDDGKRGR